MSKMAQFMNILAAGFLMLLLYLMKVPIPKGFSRPLSLRLMLAAMKLGNMYVSLVVWLGRSRLKQIRMSYAELARRSPKVRTHGLMVTDRTLDGVKVKIFQPKAGSSDSEGYPAVIYIHGGGWVLGTIPFYGMFAARLARTAGVVVINVDYRLAPEHPFPAAFEDCLAVTQYVLSHAQDFGADPHRVALSGDSAGGNLAAAVTLKLRDEGFRPSLKRQQLIYPALQAMDFNLPSIIQNQDGPILNRQGLAWAWSLYITGSDRLTTHFLKNSHTSKAVKKSMADANLNHQQIGKQFLYEPYIKPDLARLPNDESLWNSIEDKLMNPSLCPLVAKDFSGLPDAYIFTCQYDVLRDDGQLYARHLNDAGVEVDLSNMKSGYHGIMGFWNFQEGKDAFADIINDTITHLCKPNQVQSSL